MSLGAVEKLRSLDGMTGAAGSIVAKLRRINRGGDLTAGSPLLLRGSSATPEEAFSGGLAVGPHRHRPFRERGRDKANIYASTTQMLSVANHFASKDRIFVLRGRGAKRLFPRHKLTYPHEQEWGMPEIKSGDVIGVLEYTGAHANPGRFTANPSYGVPGP